MKKRFALVLFIVVMLVTMPYTILAGKNLNVVKSSQTVLVDGKETNFEVYNINGNNYFKLRDIAYILNGTPAQFSLAYDDVSKMISIITGKSYINVGGEMFIGGDKSLTAVKSNQSLKINGAASELLTYNLSGNNFFQLRALGNALGFGVGYNAVTDSVLINSTKEAAGSTPSIAPNTKTSESISADNIITLTTYEPTNEYSTAGYKIGSTTYLGGLILSAYNNISTAGDILTLQFLIEANENSSITIQAYCNDTNSEKSSSVSTVEWKYTSKKYTPVFVTVNKKSLKEYYGMASNPLYIKASNSSGKTVTLYYGTISTPDAKPEGTTTSSKFSLVKGFGGSNITNSYKYAGGKVYAVEYYFTLKTGSYGGNYTMKFPNDNGTDVCNFMVKSNSVYEIKYVYAISDSQSYNYKYKFNVTLSGPQSVTLSFSDTHPGKMNKGSISVKKI